jgi:hypothetical protein
MTGEINNLHPNLIAVLTQLEQRMGFTLQINSGYRTKEHNADPKVGGVPDSEHTYDPAMGADVLCKRSVTRYRMLSELFAMGVRRIGIGETFIHVGVAQDKPMDVCWHYYPAPLDVPRTS